MASPISTACSRARATNPAHAAFPRSSYPLTRPLFVYVSRKAADRPDVTALMEFFLDEKRIGNREFMLDIGYVPANRKLRDASRAILAGKITGTAFGGSFAGLTSQAIVDKYSAHAKSAAKAPADAGSGKGN